ncbi:hypothetical protein C3V36_02815 [Lachnospiraceae bacterium oral taxon 500]|nr:hypothetical protein C3V36_02815 [Lachnospiraceae bacterium oral taxon 500]
MFRPGQTTCRAEVRNTLIRGLLELVAAGKTASFGDGGTECDLQSKLRERIQADCSPGQKAKLSSRVGRHPGRSAQRFD